MNNPFVIAALVGGVIVVVLFVAVFMFSTPQKKPEQVAKGTTSGAKTTGEVRNKDVVKQLPTQDTEIEEVNFADLTGGAVMPEPPVLAFSAVPVAPVREIAPEPTTTQPPKIAPEPTSQTASKGGTITPSVSARDDVSAHRNYSSVREYHEKKWGGKRTYEVLSLDDATPYDQDDLEIDDDDLRKVIILKELLDRTNNTKK